MVVYSSPARSFLVFLLPITPRPCCCSGYKPPRAKIPPISCCNGRDDNTFSAPKRSVGDPLSLDSFCSGISCSCSRRRFIDAAAVTTLLPTCCSFASNLHTDYTVHLSPLFSLYNLLISSKTGVQNCNFVMLQTRDYLRGIFFHPYQTTDNYLSVRI